MESISILDHTRRNQTIVLFLFLLTNLSGILLGTFWTPVQVNWIVAHRRFLSDTQLRETVTKAWVTDIFKVD